MLKEIVVDGDSSVRADLSGLMQRLLVRELFDAFWMSLFDDGRDLGAWKEPSLLVRLRETVHVVAALREQFKQAIRDQAIEAGIIDMHAVEPCSEADARATAVAAAFEAERAKARGPGRPGGPTTTTTSSKAARILKAQSQNDIKRVLSTGLMPE